MRCECASSVHRGELLQIERTRAELALLLEEHGIHEVAKDVEDVHKPIMRVFKAENLVLVQRLAHCQRPLLHFGGCTSHQRIHENLSELRVDLLTERELLVEDGAQSDKDAASDGLGHIRKAFQQLSSVLCVCVVFDECPC